jgi:hypothetical protein
LLAQWVKQPLLDQNKIGKYMQSSIGWEMHQSQTNSFSPRKPSLYVHVNVELEFNQGHEGHGLGCPAQWPWCTHCKKVF